MNPVESTFVFFYKLFLTIEFTPFNHEYVFCIKLISGYSMGCKSLTGKLVKPVRMSQGGMG